MGKQQECAHPMGHSTLKTWYGAPATNDRCSDNDVREFCEYLLKRMEEEENCKVSPEPWDWQRIHGEDFEEWQEPLAPVHTKKRDYKDDNGGWSEEFDSSDFDDYSLFVIPKTLQPLAAGHYNDENKPLQPMATGRTYNKTIAQLLETGRGTHTRRRRHYKEIANDFVLRLMGSGTFGWPPLVWKQSSRKYQAEEHSAGDNITGSVQDIVCVTNTRKEVFQQNNSEEISPKPLECPRNARTPLETIRKTLAQANSETSLSAWQKRRKRRNTKQSKALSSTHVHAAQAATTHPTAITTKTIKHNLKIDSCESCTYPITTRKKETVHTHTQEQGSQVVTLAESLIPPAPKIEHRLIVEKQVEVAQRPVVPPWKPKEGKIKMMNTLKATSSIPQKGEASASQRMYPEGSPTRRQSPRVKRNKNATSQKRDVPQVSDGIESGLIVIKDMYKKRKSPRHKQWRRCGCGRLYRIQTGLCACTEAKVPQTTSRTKTTKTKRSEKTTPHWQTERKTTTKQRTEQPSMHAEASQPSPPAMQQTPLLAVTPYCGRIKREDHSSILQSYIKIEELNAKIADPEPQSRPQGRQRFSPPPLKRLWALVPTPLVPRRLSWNFRTLPSVRKAITVMSSPNNDSELVSAMKKSSSMPSKRVMNLKQRHNGKPTLTPTTLTSGENAGTTSPPRMEPTQVSESTRKESLIQRGHQAQHRDYMGTQHELATAPEHNKGTAPYRITPRSTGTTKCVMARMK